MANLETLELRISANAQEATKGLGKLISSLRVLSNTLTDPVQKLTALNEQLMKLKGISKNTFNAVANSAKSTKNIKTTTAAIEQQAEAVKKLKETGGNRGVDVSKLTFPNKVPDDVWQKQFEENLAKERAKRLASRQAAEAGAQRRAAEKAAEVMRSQQAYNSIRKEMDARGEQAKAVIENANAYDLLKLKYDSMKQSIIDDARIGKLSNEQLVQRTLQLRKLEQQMTEVQSSTKSTSLTMGKLKDSFKQLTGGLSGLFSRIKRIATTMLIRKAIRSLVASMKEGINNVYEWSKATGGQFAQAMDTAKAKIKTMKNSLGASLSPVIQSLIPLFNSLCSAVINAANWINQFISLLSGKTSWTKAVETATDATDGLAESASGAGSAARDALAAFDELNVIQSGSGGGSGTTASTTEDYEGMFEEITKFDEKIREITQFIKDNIESVRAIAVAAGTAILAWKFSKAFAGTLSMLSSVLGFVATGAVIAITLQAVWALTGKYLESGDEGWLFASALTSAVGSTAAWVIAKKLIGGKAGAYAASFTLAMSAVTDIVADVQHTDVGAFSKESLLTRLKAALEAGAAVGILLKTTGLIAGTSGILLAAGGAALAVFAVATLLKLAANKNSTTVQWGDISLTQDQINDYVLESGQVFTVNPKTAISLVENNISLSEGSRSNVQTALTKLLGTMNIIKLGVDSADTYKTLLEDVNAVVDKADEYVGLAKETGKLTLQFTPSLVGSNANAQGDWFTSYTSGWDMVEQFVKDKGKEIGKLLVENEKGEIEVSSPELLQTLLKQLNDVTAAMAEATIGSDAFSQMRIGLGDLTEATGTQVLESFKEYKKQLTDAYTELVNEQYAKQGQLVRMLGKIDPNSEAYREAKAKYEEMGRNLVQAVEDGVNSQIEPGQNLVMEWILGNHNGQHIGGESIGYDYETLKKMLTDGGLSVENISNAMNEIFEAAVWEGTLTRQELDIMKELDIVGWDLLSEELQQKILQYVTVTPETIEMLKKGLGLNASEIVQFSNWSAFTLETKLAFLTSLTNAFGSEEAIAAAKEAGIDIDYYIKEGMSSGNKNIRKAAEALNKLIGKTINKKKISWGVSLEDAKNSITRFIGSVGELTPVVDVDTKVKNGATKKVTDNIEKQSNPVVAVGATVIGGTTAKLTKTIETGTNPTVGVKSKWATGAVTNLVNEMEKNAKPKVTASAAFKSGTTTSLKKQIETGVNPKVSVTASYKNGTTTTLTDQIEDKVKPEVPVTASFMSGVLAELKRLIEALKPNITAKVTGDVAELTKKIKDALKAKLIVKDSGTGTSVAEWQLETKAKGGLVQSGDLFIANENGSSEMIGRFGNQTAVANQEQMVEAMARGVSYAQTEQNNLLREQNRLLTAILQKEGTVRLEASSALGRTAKRSIDMYNGLYGGR